jgi:Variant SH3 domain
LSVNHSEFHSKVLSIYFYRRRRHKSSTEDPGFVFDKDVFAKSVSSPELDKYAMVDLAKWNSSSTLSPVRYRESFSTCTFDDNSIGRQPQGNSSFKIANADEMVIPTLAFPKPLAEKNRRTPRGKPAWLSPITTNEEVRSPPQTYSMSSAEQEVLIPIPPPRSPQKFKTTPMSPTIPITRQSYLSVKSRISQHSLIIPDFDLVSVVSPARSESFAPKDLVLPSPPPTPTSSAFGLNSTRSQIVSSRVEHDKGVELPRLMNVVALFTPNLPDELNVKVGDTVRIIEEYKDGWCFVQFSGEKDAPKGVVPLVCLQERARLASFKRRSSNKSLTNLNWR